MGGRLSREPAPKATAPKAAAPKAAVPKAGAPKSFVPKAAGAKAADRKFGARAQFDRLDQIDDDSGFKAKVVDEQVRWEWFDGHAWKSYDVASTKQVEDAWKQVDKQEVMLTMGFFRNKRGQNYKVKFVRVPRDDVKIQLDPGETRHSQTNNQGDFFEVRRLAPRIEINIPSDLVTTDCEAQLELLLEYVNLAEEADLPSISPLARFRSRIDLSSTTQSPLGEKKVAETNMGGVIEDTGGDSKEEKVCTETVDEKNINQYSCPQCTMINANTDLKCCMCGAPNFALAKPEEGAKDGESSGQSHDRRDLGEEKEEAKDKEGENVQTGSELEVGSRVLPALRRLPTENHRECPICLEVRRTEFSLSSF
jgi:hypothetical protein